MTDPRSDRSKLHDLLAILALAIGAVTAGTASWNGIEEFGEAQHAWLKPFLALPNGIPHRDTVRRHVERLDPDEFQRCFLGSIEALREATEGQVIALDGKTLRRSFDRAKGESALHWSTPGRPPTTCSWARSPWTRSPTRSRRSPSS